MYQLHPYPIQTALTRARANHIYAAHQQVRGDHNLRWSVQANEAVPSTHRVEVGGQVKAYALHSDQVNAHINQEYFSTVLELSRDGSNLGMFGEAMIVRKS